MTDGSVRVATNTFYVGSMDYEHCEDDEEDLGKGRTGPVVAAAAQDPLHSLGVGLFDFHFS